MKLLLISLSFFVTGFSPVFSQELSEIVRLQLMKGWRAESGTHISGLEINLLPGWKTYWKQPGDSGLIPTFDWSGSKNISEVKIFWPHPTIFSEGEEKTIGYKNKVILPLEFKPLNNSKLIKPKVKIRLGVCKDVCIPISRVLSTKLRSSKKKIDQEITNYFNLRPKLISKNEIVNSNCEIKVVNDNLIFRSNIRFSHNLPDLKAIAVELPNSNLWFDMPTFKQKGPSLDISANFQNFGEGPLILTRSRIVISLIGNLKSMYLNGC